MASLAGGWLHHAHKQEDPSDLLPQLPQEAATPLTVMGIGGNSSAACCQPGACLLLHHNRGQQDTAG